MKLEPRILIDEKTGEKFEVKNRANMPSSYFSGEPDEIYILRPFIECKPLFVDLAGCEVFEGNEVYWYTKGGIVSCEAKDNLHFDKESCFKNRSDCERWVASNVKTLTLKEALELLKNLSDFSPANIQIGGKYNPYQWIDDHLKEKCL